MGEVNEILEIKVEEFINTILEYSEKEEKINNKLNNVLLSSNKHYINLINNLLEKSNIKKHIKNILLNSEYNDKSQDVIKIFGKYSAYISINEKIGKKYPIVNKIIGNILKDLYKREIEKFFSNLVIMYIYYNDILRNFNSNNYYYYYYYKSNLLKKYKELSEEEIKNLLLKKFKNEEEFDVFFQKSGNRIKNKIIDFLELVRVYINFLNIYRKSEYINKKNQIKQKTEISLIGIKGNIFDRLEHYGELHKKNRINTIKKNLSILGKKKEEIEKISILKYYLSKITNIKKDGEEKINYNNLIKYLETQFKHIAFTDINLTFFGENLYNIILHLNKVKKGIEEKKEIYTEVLELNAIKKDIEEKYKKNDNYIFTLKDFILTNDNQLKRVISGRNNRGFELFIKSHIDNIIIEEGYDKSELLKQIGQKKEWWFLEQFNILSINKKYKKNIYDFLSKDLNIKEYNLIQSIVNIKIY